MPTKLVKTVKPRGKGVPFKPGQSGNPKGRPVAELTFGHVLRTKLISEYTSEEYEQAVAYIDAITDHMAKIASDKSTDPQVRLAYIKEIADRTEGKPKQQTELTGKDGGPIEVSNLTTAELQALIEAAK